MEALEVKEGRRDKRARRGSRVDPRMDHRMDLVEVLVLIQVEISNKVNKGNLNHLRLMKIFQGMLTSFSYTWS